MRVIEEDFHDVSTIRVTFFLRQTPKKPSPVRRGGLGFAGL
jgi:hypothetical protein